jgi:kynurenine formamidase
MRILQSESPIAKHRRITMHIIDLSHPLDAHVPIYPGDLKFTCTPVAILEDDGCAVSALHLGSHTGTHLDAPSHFIHDGKTVDELDLSILVGPAIVVDVSYKQAREAIDASDLAGALASLNSLNAGPESASISEFSTPRILLIHTGWSKHWPDYDTYSTHPHLTPSAAEAIVRAGIRVVGVDTFSPDSIDPIPSSSSSNSPSSFSAPSSTSIIPVSEPTSNSTSNLQPIPSTHPYPVHRILLGAGCMIAENLTNLDQLLPNTKDSQTQTQTQTQTRTRTASASSSTWMVSLVPLKIAGCDGAPIRAFAWRSPSSS